MNEKKKKMSYILATPPFDKIGAFTGARIALTTIMDGHETVVILMEDGVYGALKGQVTTQFFKTVQILEDFIELGGILLVCGLCLKERGIPNENVIDGAEIIDMHRLTSVITEGDQTVFFGA
ncbi:MAG: DsrE family protein [Candidatus Thorarchaeota archaeon]